MIVRETYAWANPYGNADPEKLSHGHWRDLYGKQLWKAAELAEHLARTRESPEIFLLGNFSPDRTAFVALCRERRINFAHWEDGFFPHYWTQHLDPLGFCWESSLPGMVFRCCSDRQRERARAARAAWLARPAGELPPGVRKPFVVWPLQLIGDQVNRCDLNVPDWTGLLRDFRARLPATFQLVLKPHPLGRPVDVNGLDAVVAELPDTTMVPHGSDLTRLLRECHAVAGANSSVLYEARLMHHKPAYAYSRSWFTNHPEVVIPVERTPSPGRAPELPRLEWLENPALLRTDFLDDYTDWFLAQLLARQIDRRQFTEAAQHREAVRRLSDQSYREHGEAIFDV
jgi:hypothetical protein